MSSRIEVISDSDIGGYIFEGTDDDEGEEVGMEVGMSLVDGLVVLLLLPLLPLPNKPPPLVILPQVE